MPPYQWIWAILLSATMAATPFQCRRPDPHAAHQAKVRAAAEVLTRLGGEWVAEGQWVLGCLEQDRYLYADWGPGSPYEGYRAGTDLQVLTITWNTRFLDVNPPRQVACTAIHEHLHLTTGLPDSDPEFARLAQALDQRFIAAWEAQAGRAWKSVGSDEEQWRSAIEKNGRWW